MATVYLAVQEIFEREVALKVMSKGLADDPSFGQRFLREARIVSQLVHPNIVTVYDVGVHDGAYFLSMEYVEGKDLKHMRKRLSFPQKIQVVRDIAKALDFAGSKGYVHRDIKPENIMVYNKGRRAVLMDFGIARAAESDISVTQAGTAVGTPHYMSPEQAKGKAVDSRADIYGLGVVFYYLLIGQVPYDAESAVAIGIKHITEPIPLLPHHLEPLQFILDGMMAKDPDDRFQDGGELAAALEIVDVDELEELEREYQRARREAKEPVLNSPTMISIQSDLISKGATGGITQIDDPDRFTVSFDSIDKEERSKSRWIWITSVAVFAAIVGLSSYFVTQDESAVSGVSSEEEKIARQKSLADLIRGTSLESEQLGKLPPGIKSKKQAQMEKELQQLTKKYNADNEKLEPLVKKLRQLIVMLPNKRDYQEQYLALAQTHLRSIGPYFSSGAFKKAQRQLDQLQQLFPEYNRQEVASLRSRLANRSTIEKNLALAEKLEKEGKLTEPEGSNALALYREVLALDPDIYPAKLGLGRIARALSNDARNKLRRGDDADALALLGKALQIDPNNNNALAVKSQLNEKRTVTQQVNMLFDEADRQVFQGNYYGPVGQSAFDSYSQILALDESNRSALRGLESLLDKVEQRASRLVSEGRYDDARASLEAAYKQRKGDGKIQLAMLKVDEAINIAKYSDEPKIVQIRASGQSKVDLNRDQPRVIDVANKIYFKFSYDNFPNAGSLLDARLLNEKQSRLLAEVPVVTSGTSGEGEFIFEKQARSTFEGGYYNVELVLQDKTLKSFRFRVE